MVNTAVKYFIEVLMIIDFLPDALSVCIYIYIYIYMGAVLL